MAIQWEFLFGRVEPFDIEGMLHYPYGRSDFAHSGGGLLYGTHHVSDNGLVGETFQEMVEGASYVLDLDAGTLFVNYERFWTVDLSKLEGRDPESVFHFLSNYPFYKNDEVPPGVTRENAHEQDYNVALNAGLAALPSVEQAPLAAASTTPVVEEPSGRMSYAHQAPVEGATWLVRVHPADFVLVRMLSQAIQQTARVRPEFEPLVDLLRVERVQDHVGLVVEKVPGNLLRELEALGEGMVQAFGALTATLDPDGGHTIKSSNATVSSSGWIGAGPDVDDGFDDLINSRFPRPKAEDLSAPFSFERREQLRDQWIAELRNGTAGDRDRQIDSLRSEAFLALATFDPKAYAQLSTPEVLALIGPIAEQLDGVYELAVPMARVESMINAQGLRDRYNALPQEARDLLQVGMTTLARHEFHLAMGLPTARRSRSP